MSQTFNSREIATVLAALRYWQRTVENPAAVEPDYFEDDCEPLTDIEIDSLCVKINLDMHSNTGREAEPVGAWNPIPEVKPATWYAIGSELRESASQAHNGVAPPLDIAYSFLLDNPEAFGYSAWPPGTPEQPPEELRRGYELPGLRTGMFDMWLNQIQTLVREALAAGVPADHITNAVGLVVEALAVCPCAGVLHEQTCQLAGQLVTRF